MKKYLIILKTDIADEGEVVQVSIVTDDELKMMKKLKFTGYFGNIEGSQKSYKELVMTEELINESEIETLNKFGFLNVNTGYFNNNSDKDIEDIVFEYKESTKELIKKIKSKKTTSEELFKIYKDTKDNKIISMILKFGDIKGEFLNELLKNSVSKELYVNRYIINFLEKNKRIDDSLIDSIVESELKEISCEVFKILIKKYELSYEKILKIWFRYKGKEISEELLEELISKLKDKELDYLVYKYIKKEDSYVSLYMNLKGLLKNVNKTNETIKYIYLLFEHETNIGIINMILEYKDISSELLNKFIIDITKSSTKGYDEEAIKKIKEILNNNKYEVDKETVRYIRYLKKYYILVKVLNRNKQVYTKEEYISLFKEIDLIEGCYTMKVDAYIASNFKSDEFIDIARQYGLDRTLIELCSPDILKFDNKLMDYISSIHKEYLIKYERDVYILIARGILNQDNINITSIINDILVYFIKNAKADIEYKRYISIIKEKGIKTSDEIQILMTE